MLGLLLVKGLLFGSVGMLLECWFTGLHTMIFDRNLRGTCQTYTWMSIIYGLAGTGMSYLHRAFTGIPFIGFAVLFIYVVEFSTGWLLRKILGRCPWEYGATRFGIMGLVRLDYIPWWLLVAVGFDSLCQWLDRAILLISSV